MHYKKLIEKNPLQKYLIYIHIISSHNSFSAPSWYSETQYRKLITKGSVSKIILPRWSNNHPKIRARMKSRRRWTNTIKRNHPLKRMWSLTRWGGHVRQKPETYFLWNQADFTRSNRKRISKMDLLPISILWKKKTFTWRTKGKGRLHASSFRCSYSCPEEGIVTFWQSRFRHC